MNATQVYKFREVMDAGDAISRFEMVEERGDRALIRFIGSMDGETFVPTTMVIRPTQVVLMNEIESCAS